MQLFQCKYESLTKFNMLKMCVLKKKREKNYPSIKGSTLKKYSLTNNHNRDTCRLTSKKEMCIIY